FRPHNSPPVSSEGALHLVFRRDQLVTDLRATQLLLPREQMQRAGWQVLREQFLGYWQERPCFAVEIDETAELDPMRFQQGNLYQLLGRGDESLFALAGRASQLLAWERD